MPASVFIAPSADVIGDLEVGENVGIWCHATVRADSDRITIGTGTNVQDNCVLHVDAGHPLTIGDYVTIGHGAIVHGCNVGDGTLIGMGAILLNDCKIGKNCIIGAGTLVTGGVEIPDGSVVLGNPGKVRRSIRPEEILRNQENAQYYIEEAKKMIDY
ncbi:MAG: gamma carbonic anhydrase family protein [Lachnospiraceae bacterium]|nr:gamma carbonic anhydrase family protein [Lachnospiraceae bacterium]